MSSSVILEFVVLAVVLSFGGILIYSISKTRKMYSETKAHLARASASVNDLHKAVAEIGKVVQLAASDGRALQVIAMQIERTVADLDQNLGNTVGTNAERQDKTIAQLSNDLDLRDSKLLQLLERIEAGLHDLSEAQASRVSPATSANGDVTIGHEVSEKDVELRFKLVNEWVSRYLGAILRRASRPWTTSQQLVEGIPYQLRAETEVLGQNILLIGTKDSSDRIAVLLSGSKPPATFADWFQVATASASPNNTQDPAIVTRTKGAFKLVKPGLLPRSGVMPSQRALPEGTPLAQLSESTMGRTTLGS